MRICLDATSCSMITRCLEDGAKTTGEEGGGLPELRGLGIFTVSSGIIMKFPQACYRQWPNKLGCLEEVDFN